MAHRNNQPRTPQSSHNLQDKRLFSLSGGIPHEYFDDLDFISMRRGQRIAAPAPSGDPWGYYAERGRSRQAGTIRPTQEASIQPHTESSEAMDTDEGQRTTARLIEEARCLSQVTMELTYTTIEEPIITMTEGSKAVISDILATRDPRELTLPETGEKGPAPLAMGAGLPAGSFSLFDFEREFWMRHGVKPEDADKSWQSHYTSRESSILTVSSDQEIGPQQTEAPSPTSPTSGVEIIRTPGVTRDQGSAEKKAYAENIVTLDARLLQDNISGRWTRQQLYEPTPSWYPDNFHGITIPWESQSGEYEAPFRNKGSILTYGYPSRLLPIGPPSDVTSTTTPPSTVGPLASVSETAIPQKKVDFNISPYAEELLEVFLREIHQ